MKAQKREDEMTVGGADPRHVSHLETHSPSTPKEDENSFRLVNTKQNKKKKEVKK